MPNRLGDNLKKDHQRSCKHVVEKIKKNPHHIRTENVTVCWLHLNCAMWCCAVLCCAVLCCAVLCCAVLCCAVLCCAVLCCAVLCCAVLWIFVLDPAERWTLA
jgi:hypothetical protein